MFQPRDGSHCREPLAARPAQSLHFLCPCEDPSLEKSCGKGRVEGGEGSSTSLNPLLVFDVLSGPSGFCIY